MMVDVPVHPALSALLLLLFGIVLLTHVVGLVSGRFYAGLIVAIAAPGVLGATLWLRSRRTPPRSMSSADRVWIYHYAVDQLFASATALLRLPLNRAIDLSALALWIALLLAAGLLFHAGVLAEAASPPQPMNRMPALWRMSWTETTITEGDAAAIGWLRRHIQPGEMVLCGSRLELACAIYGGFPQPTISTASHLGYGEPEQLRLILLESARTPEEFRAIDVCWAIRAIPSDLDPNSVNLRFGAAGSPGPGVVRLCPDSPDPAR